MRAKISMIFCAAMLCVGVTACAGTPNTKPRAPINQPVDAFEAVGQPRKNPGTPQSETNTLSHDVQRLQNARQTYRYAQQRHAAEIRRRQANCRSQPDSKKVAIKDGSGDPNATYCQPAGAANGNGSR